MKKQIKKYACCVAAAFIGFLSYIGAAVIAAGLTNGDEISLIIAVIPAVAIACFVALKGGVE